MTIGRQRPGGPGESVSIAQDVLDSIIGRSEPRADQGAVFEFKLPEVLFNQGEVVGTQFFSHNFKQSGPTFGLERRGLSVSDGVELLEIPKKHSDDEGGLVQHPRWKSLCSSDTALTAMA